jgi:YggT family protein
MLLLDAISEIELFVNVFATVYGLVLVLYVLLSWIRLPSSLGPLQRFLYDVCEPYLRLWRRILPLSFGPVDFSPIIAILAVYAAARLVTFVLSQFH